MAVSVESAKAALEKLSCYVKIMSPIANAHMVHFYTQNHYQTLLPSSVQRYLADHPEIHSRILSNELFQTDAQFGGELGQYMAHAKAHYLSNLNILSEMDEVYNNCDVRCPTKSQFQFEHFMTPKKAHEVSVYCDVIDNIANAAESGVVVDIGCGKGHLGTMLSLSHSYPVLGLEAQGSIGHVAEKRDALEKMYNALRRKQEDNHSKSKVTFQRVTHYVTEDLEIDPIINENYPELRNRNAILIGLHTCGNLAPSCVKLFLNNQRLKALCNVACCYHLIDEEYCPDPYGKTEFETFGFPMSQQLRSERFSLGRNARMMCVQPVERFAAEEKTQFDVLFYRAVLQALLVEKFGVAEMQVQVGRMKKTCANFLEYAHRALKRLDLSNQVTDEEILRFETTYATRRHELECFFQLRALLAPVIEGFILLDRLVFLLENNINAFLVRVFDPVKSPRCYALLALKKAHCR